MKHHYEICIADTGITEQQHFWNTYQRKCSQMYCSQVQALLSQLVLGVEQKMDGLACTLRQSKLCDFLSLCFTNALFSNSSLVRFSFKVPKRHGYLAIALVNGSFEVFSYLLQTLFHLFAILASFRRCAADSFSKAFACSLCLAASFCAT